MADLGSLVPITFVVRDAAGNPTNATTVALIITLPNQTTATPTVTNPPAEVGTYTYDYAPPEPGRYEWRMTSTGPTTAYGPVAFNVTGASPGPIIGLDEAKKHLNMSLAKTNDDDELRGIIVGATPVVEDVVGPVVVRTMPPEDHDPGPYLMLWHTPVVSLTSVAVVLTSGTSYDVDDLDLNGETGKVRRLDGGRFTSDVRVVYVAGRPIVPANILEGTKVIVGHAWDTQRGQLRRAGFAGEEDLIPTPSGFLVPRRAMEWLRPQAVGPMMA